MQTSSFFFYDRNFSPNSSHFIVRGARERSFVFKTRSKSFLSCVTISSNAYFFAFQLRKNQVSKLPKWFVLGTISYETCESSNGNFNSVNDDRSGAPRKFDYGESDNRSTRRIGRKASGIYPTINNLVLDLYNKRRRKWIKF